MALGAVLQACSKSTPSSSAPSLTLAAPDKPVKWDIADDNKVQIEMTLTSPACPVAGILPGEVEEKVKTVQGVSDAAVELVWDPPWNPSMMTEEAQLELGILY